MQNKMKIFLVSIAVCIFSFSLIEKANAETCWTGSCKAACSSSEEVSKTVGDGCGGGDVCCVAKSVTPTNPTPAPSPGVQDYCVNLKDGDKCLTFNSESGTCKNGTCVASGSGGGTPISSSGSGWNSSSLRIFNLPEASVYMIIVGILDWLLTIIGIVAVIALVISGLQYFLVATDEKMLETAKRTMKAAIIGLIVALSGVIIIYAVNTMLNAGFLF
ncbi:MAG: pilin [Candidatus Moranbacteria bacterium]|nr:pilin [Candidatus Moranbacteria bacterium]